MSTHTSLARIPRRYPFRRVLGGTAALLALASLGFPLGCSADLPDLPRGEAPVQVLSLTEGTLPGGHPGWGWPDCANCHATAHNSAFDLDQCSVCHGSNGAPTLGASHSGWGLDGCATCHPNPTSHSGDLSTSGCVGCHGTNGSAASLPTVSIPMVNEAHTGWGWANCGACHSDTGTHGGAYAMTSCGACHGGNGAPDRPRNHWLEGCNDCHADGPYPFNPYTHQGFEHSEPRACVYCHR